MNDNVKINGQGAKLEPNPPVIPVSQKNFKDCITLADRAQALHMIPKRKIIAEVGVAFGDFSKKLLAITEPALFYAIDSFHKKKGDRGFMGRDNAFLDQSHLELYFRKFAPEIADGIVIVKQGFSWDVLETFDDEYFDYLYIDAGHQYVNVKKDIDVSYRKIKNKGFIQFNDYNLYSLATGQQYGIVQAVNEFLSLSKHQARAFCLHPFGCHDILIQVFK